jgi:hypothetical protein
MSDAAVGDGNPLPDYYLVLGNAHAASEEVDYSDLRSENPDSVAEFQHLLDESAKSQIELCKYRSRRDGQSGRSE